MVTQENGYIWTDDVPDKTKFNITPYLCFHNGVLYQWYAPILAGSGLTGRWYMVPVIK